MCRCDLGRMDKEKTSVTRCGRMWKLCSSTRHPALLVCIVLEIFIHSVKGLNVCMSGSATSCEECLLIHPSCAWCAQEDFGQARTLTSRCDFSQNLQKRGCDAPFIENPRSGSSVLQSKPLSYKGSGVTQYDVIQIYPQKISLSLRPGDQASFEVQVRPVEDYPVDLYYLMDLSLSMKDDLDTIRNLGTKLAEEMRKLTSNFRLGFGSFVDKNISPFSYTASKYQDNPCNGYKLFPNCVPTFGFRHLLSLTDKVDRFNEEVQKQMVSRNRDAPEGGFDAILQAAVCREKIGWRKEAYHLLVFATDDVPHLALDGKLGGLVHPHDGQCHLNDKNEYSASTKMDYPSLALLGEKLAENNIFLIFAVIKRHYVLYKNLTALIPGTTVEILDQDSKNIIQLIVNAYNNIRSKVELSVWDHPEDLSLAFSATCQDGQPLTGLRKCADLKIGDTVSFNVTVDARGCPPKGTRKSFTIRPVGFKDRLEVSVDYRCDCRCTYHTKPNSSRCNSAGTYNCGLCRCEPGYLGARCECQEGEVDHQHLSACREAEGKQVCSGRGECSCNQCLCYESEFGKIYGTFCECDDFSCARHKGILCSGHGECHCGECKCHAGYIGDNCNCSTETASCVSDDGKICSGRGSCVCGRCQCTEPGAFGDTCEKCPTCPDACGTKRECIECRLFNTGRLADNQTCQRMCKDEITTVETLKTDDPNAVQCVYKTENDCVMKFTYSEHANGQSVLTALKEPECAVAPNAMTVLLAVVGSILLMGIVLLALWKLVITVHDRREFARFQSARSRARYEMASNPVYKRSVPMETDFDMHGIKSLNGGVH
ncbi:integrin beta-5 precursor [Danio rerio]|uniref:Integrin beta n=1 Tax=Danio rerio TaxID=7955 RepID=Q1MSX8_DANRE|nr:integrin beta-5 [Danio rerio]CAK11239.1 integrin, beta 5 [Danio rerio]|eukprot:NP_001076305.1 integrin beta-5 [Danio rerio]